jgi:hypothetical protein
MKNLIRVDFGTNRIERTKEEWIDELIENQLESLDSMDNNDHMITYLLCKGFKGYEQFTVDELIEEIESELGHRYDIEED